MTPHIEFCQQNVSAHVKLSDVPGTVKEKCCLQRCGTCYATPFFVVDGELRTGASHEAILDTVEEATEE